MLFPRRLGAVVSLAKASKSSEAHCEKLCGNMTEVTGEMGSVGKGDSPNAPPNVASIKAGLTKMCT